MIMAIEYTTIKRTYRVAEDEEGLNTHFAFLFQQ